jgi:hypothetical protein
MLMEEKGFLVDEKNGIHAICRCDDKICEWWLPLPSVLSKVQATLVRLIFHAVKFVNFEVKTEVRH